MVHPPQASTRNTVQRLKWFSWWENSTVLTDCSTFLTHKLTWQTPTNRASSQGQSSHIYITTPPQSAPQPAPPKQPRRHLARAPAPCTPFPGRPRGTEALREGGGGAEGTGGSRRALGLSRCPEPASRPRGLRSAPRRCSALPAVTSGEGQAARAAPRAAMVQGVEQGPGRGVERLTLCSGSYILAFLTAVIVCTYIHTYNLSFESVFLPRLQDGAMKGFN